MRTDLGKKGMKAMEMDEKERRWRLRSYNDTEKVRMIVVHSNEINQLVFDDDSDENDGAVKDLDADDFLRLERRRVVRLGQDRTKRRNELTLCLEARKEYGPPITPQDHRLH